VAFKQVKYRMAKAEIRRPFGAPDDVRVYNLDSREACRPKAEYDIWAIRCE
jgi:hypothetical protein